MSRTTQASGSISIPAILGIVFIILKLCKVIAWSWWWVLAPFWIPIAICIIVVLILVLCGKGDILDDDF